MHDDASHPLPHTARAIGLAAAFFAAVAALMAASGLFSWLELAAFAAFAAAFALLTYLLDRDVRAAVDRALAPRLRKSPAPSPAARPGAPSAARTSARGAAGRRVKAAG